MRAVATDAGPDAAADVPYNNGKYPAEKRIPLSA